MGRFLRRTAGLAILGALAAALARRAGRPPELTGAGAAVDEGAVTTPPGTARESAAPGIAATPPVETPGPSVTAPGLPESETERAEWADYLEPDPEQLAETDHARARLAAEEAAAAAEAAAIGGPHPRYEHDDPAMRPVYEAGGGEAEGFEAAEEALIRNATHDEGGGKPLRDAFRPEVESDLSNAVYADADELESTERLEEADEGRGPARPSDA